MLPSCNETADSHILIKVVRVILYCRLSFWVLNTVGDICTDLNDLQVSIATCFVTIDWKRKTKRSTKSGFLRNRVDWCKYPCTEIDSKKSDSSPFHAHTSEVLTVDAPCKRRGRCTTVNTRPGVSPGRAARESGKVNTAARARARFGY